MYNKYSNVIKRVINLLKKKKNGLNKLIIQNICNYYRIVVL